jgi:membrane protease subunit (stomatin/prohibitin family)
LFLDSFVVENISLPEELQKILDQRIGMNMVGDMGRYQQFQVAQSIPIAAANEGGGAAGAGVGLGAGLLMAQQMMGAMRPPTPPAPQAPPAPSAGGGAPSARQGDGGAGSAAQGGAATKFCMNCGKSIPRPAHFCPECGTAQQ